MAFTTGSDYGLATLGCTQAMVFDSEVFYRQLASDRTWGQSFQQWYNEQGNQVDRWNIGAVLTGDPLLILQREKR